MIDIPALPDASQASLVSRTSYIPDAHPWTANADKADEHNGVLNANEVPCYIELNWQSKRGGKTVHVGTFKLNLRALARVGFARLETSHKVRLRFVRKDDATVVIQINDASPALPVGLAVFD